MIWIGPTPDSITALGDKVTARRSPRRPGHRSRRESTGRARRR